MSGAGNARTSYEPIQQDAASDPSSFVKNGTISRRSLVRGGKSQILWTGAAIVLPMLAFTGVLLGLVYANLVDPSGALSTESKLTEELNLNRDIYCTIESTRLVFIASWASTFAAILLPPVMLLYSYPVAYDLGLRTDALDKGKLPSPFQLELLIGLLAGRIGAMWSWIGYACTKKTRRTPIISGVTKSGAMLVYLSIIAILITAADTWLHISTVNVVYVSNSTLTPGTSDYQSRYFLDGCLRDAADRGLTSTCSMSQPSDGPLYFGSAAYVYATFNNVSQTHFIYTHGNASIIGPAYVNAEKSFTATSIASSTSCEMVTTACDTVFDSGGCEACQNLNYNCTPAKAGLELSGNFLDIAGITENSTELDENVKYGLKFYYFTSGNKTGVLSSSAYNSTLIGNRALDTTTTWWALKFFFPRNMYTQAETLSRLDTVTFGSRRLNGGIVSCNSTLYDVTYEYFNATITNARFSVLNATAASALALPMMEGVFTEAFRPGLIAMAPGADEPKFFANRIANVYDRLSLSVGASASILGRSRPLELTQHTTQLVSRVPKAPFLMLVILQLMYVAIGIAMTLVALVYQAKGARDVQARLTVPAVVAERFEEPALVTGAKSINGMFAERHSMPTTRVGFARSEEGGRRYFQLPPDSGKAFE